MSGGGAGDLFKTCDYNTSHVKTYVALELPHEEHASHFFNNSREENTQKLAQARFHRQNGQVCYCKIHGYQQTAFGEDQGAYGLFHMDEIVVAFFIKKTGT